MAMQQNHSLTLLDTLYCEEEKWEDEEEEEEESESEIYNGETNKSCSALFSLLEQDMFWEDEELVSLFAKEEEQQKKQAQYLEEEEEELFGRGEAVEWILKVNGHYGFTALTAVLAINYLDRFLSCSLRFQRDKPWMIHLVAVTCLSLAAKVEETQVPLLLDLQVNDMTTKYVFEAKTVQRMEVLVLSTLQWKMHPVTPLSFLDHIIRRLGLKSNLHWEFLKRCERLLLSLLSDSRFIGYLPSVLATATMMRVIEHIEPCNATEYQNQLLNVLKLSKEKVEKCYTLVIEISSSGYNSIYSYNNNNKRKMNEVVIPNSPSGVIDASIFNSDSSNDSWSVGSSSSSSSTSSSVCSSPKEPVLKKSRAEDHDQKTRSLPSLSRVFVDIVGSPR